jgi:hypothetical protein
LPPPPRARAPAHARRRLNTPIASLGSNTPPSSLVVQIPRRPRCSPEPPRPPPPAVVEPPRRPSLRPNAGHP